MTSEVFDGAKTSEVGQFEVRTGRSVPGPSSRSHPSVVFPDGCESDPMRVSALWQVPIGRRSLAGERKDVGASNIGSSTALFLRFNRFPDLFHEGVGLFHFGPLFVGFRLPLGICDPPRDLTAQRWLRESADIATRVVFERHRGLLVTGPYCLPQDLGRTFVDEVNHSDLLAESLDEFRGQI